MIYITLFIPLTLPLHILIPKIFKHGTKKGINNNSEKRVIKLVYFSL